GWVLDNSANRRRLVEGLRDPDLDLFRQFVAGEIQWLHTSGKDDLASKQENLGQRLAWQQRYTMACLLDSLGDAERVRLLSGEPYVSRVGELKGDTRQSYLDFLRLTSRPLAAATDEELDKHW